MLAFGPPAKPSAAVPGFAPFYRTALGEAFLRCKEAGVQIQPARFPAALPEFFLKLLTDEGDLVLDPFAGSDTTGAVAEALGRRWIAVEKVQAYLEASFRFGGLQNSSM
jgi:site-specific DNA-methyltransferase (cytosine-N4-specific)